MGRTIIKFIGTILIVMLGIYGVKMVAGKYNIPVISNIAGQV